MWQKDVWVTLLSFSCGHIDARIDSPAMSPWRITRFYGNPIKEERHHSWNSLRRLYNISSLSWMVFGDFNEVLFQHEKEGRLDRNIGAMAAFQKTLTDCSLTDLGYSGPTFTWKNGRRKGLVRLRLVRAVANMEWIELFQHHRVFHLAAPHSDHLPILVAHGLERHKGYARWGHVTCFEPYWIRDGNFPSELEAGWTSQGSILDASTLFKTINASKKRL